MDEKPDGGFEGVNGDVHEGPTLRSNKRKFFKYRPLSWFSFSFYKTIFHSVAFEFPVVIDPGDPEYYKARKRAEGY